jgi:hypothetical protein
MKFVTFVWINSLAIACALLVLSLDQQELNLLCTNTDTQRSSLLDGQMITSKGSVDTFGTAIVVTGTSSLELKYPVNDPKSRNIFEVLQDSEGYLLSQSVSGSRFSTLKLAREEGNWWGQLVEFEYWDTSTSEIVTKIYYCS